MEDSKVVTGVIGVKKEKKKSCMIFHPDSSVASARPTCVHRISLDVATVVFARSWPFLYP